MGLLYDKGKKTARERCTLGLYFYYRRLKRTIEVLPILLCSYLACRIKAALMKEKFIFFQFVCTLFRQILLAVLDDEALGCAVDTLTCDVVTGVVAISVGIDIVDA